MLVVVEVEVPVALPVWTCTGPGQGPGRCAADGVRCRGDDRSWRRRCCSCAGQVGLLVLDPALVVHRVGSRRGRAGAVGHGVVRGVHRGSVGGRASVVAAVAVGSGRRPGRAAPGASSFSARSRARSSSILETDSFWRGSSPCARGASARDPASGLHQHPAPDEEQQHVAIAGDEHPTDRGADRLAEDLELGVFTAVVDGTGSDRGGTDDEQQAESQHGNPFRCRPLPRGRGVHAPSRRPSPSTTASSRTAPRPCPAGRCRCRTWATARRTGSRPRTRRRRWRPGSP